MSRRRTHIAIGVAAVLGLAVTDPVGATPTAESVRIAGPDRYETSHNVAASAWEGRTVNVAVLATGDAFADALASSYLAGALESPILLNGATSMDPGLPLALDAIGAEGVQVIGGTGAMSDQVLEDIERAGYTTTRLAGGNRFATARAVAEILPPEAIGEYNLRGRTAILANGLSFADALAAGPMSYSQGWPILLTTSDSLHAEAGAAIENLDIAHVIVVGGTAAVSDAVLGALNAVGVTTERLAGADRTITAHAIANFAVAELGYGAEDMIIARGDAFPDALPAAARGGDEVMPILLTVSNVEMGPSVAAFISDHVATMERIEVFGGTGAISEGIANRAQSLARGEP